MAGSLSAQKNALWVRAVPLVKKTVGRFVASGALRPHQATDDLLQDLLLGVSKSIDSYDPAKGAFSTWVVARAQGQILNALRAERKAQGTVSFNFDQILDASAVTVLESLERRQIKQTVRQALDLLPARHHIMLTRAFGIGSRQMLLKEIAEQDDTSVSAVQKAIMRALKELQRHLPSA